MGFQEGLLNGKNVVITGGGSGIGLGICEHFLSLGAKVFICSRSEEKLARVSEGLKEKGFEHIYYHPCDVREPEQVDAMLASAIEQMGEVNVLLNNAAGNFISPTEALSHNAFKTVVDIVLMGTANCSLSFGKYWLKNDIEACILNITTTYASTGSAFVVPSAAAKAGVLNLTRSLAVEWGRRKIRSVAIAPGPFPTEGAWSRLFPEEVAKLVDPKEHIPLGRVGNHIELQNLAAFLVSDMAPYINGEVVTIDGGEWLQGAGEMNNLLKVPKETWLELAKKHRKGK